MRDLVTSPLVGEVGVKRREGGEPQSLANISTPLPAPPPQGGREQTAARCERRVANG